MKLKPLCRPCGYQAGRSGGEDQERHHPDRCRQGEVLRRWPRIIEVGPGGVVDGKEITMTVKKGDKVITSKYPAPRSRWTARSTIVRQDDILAIVE